MVNEQFGLSSLRGDLVSQLPVDCAFWAARILDLSDIL